MFPYTLTHDTIMMVINGTPASIDRSHPNFEAVRKALFTEDWQAVPALLSPSTMISQWMADHPDFTLDAGIIRYKGSVMDDRLTDRVFKMAKEGANPAALLRFWERLQANPSYRSVHQLYAFLEHSGIPIDEEGYIVAYKSVRPDFKDWHSNTLDNSPGQTLSMPRNKISDDPNTACHEGLHLGALKYAQTFMSGGQIVLCRVDPADVVCVPYDNSAMKMRACQYTVLSVWDGQVLPDTVYQPPVEEDTTDEDSTDEDSDDEDSDDEELLHDDLVELTIAELRKRARALGIRNPNSIPGGKAVLIPMMLKAMKS